jgi:hypothetical protein
MAKFPRTRTRRFTVLFNQQEMRKLLYQAQTIEDKDSRYVSVSEVVRKQVSALPDPPKNWEWGGEE